MKREVISTKEAPAAIGAYSQAVKTGEMLYVSGQIPLTVEGDLLEGDVREQTEQVLENVKAILKAGGSDLSQVVKATIFASDMEDFAQINEVYSSYFTDDQPARAFIEVARLPKDVAVEIEVIAIAG
jgi:2-iminobutanoate/2-iminopropanoate deaminase